MPNEQENLFDVRLLRARFDAGVITREQYDSFLKSLPDDAEESEPTETRFASLWQERHEESEEEEE